MFHVILVDDNPIILEKFTSMFQKAAQKYHFEVNVLPFTNGKDLMLYISQNGHADIDLICLDVMMKPMSGIEIATLLRASGVMSELVFLTSSEVQSFYELNSSPIRNLLKSEVDEQVLTNILLQRKKECLVKRTLLCKNNENRDCEIDITSIQMIQAQDEYSVCIYTESKKYIYESTFEQVQSELKKENIVSVNESCMISLGAIKQFRGDCIVLLNNLEVKVLPKEVEILKKSLAKYLTHME